MAQTIVNNDGRALIAASVGSGKTFGVLYSLEKLATQGKAKNVLVVTPAALRHNFLKNVQKFTEGHNVYIWETGKGPTLMVSGDPAKGINFHIVSYALFRNNPDRFLQTPNGEPVDTIVCDEIHRAKNFDAITTKSLIYASRKVRNFIGLTGTVASNTPADVIPLMIAVTGQRFPIPDKSTFQRLFTKVITQRNPDGSVSRVRVLKNVSILKDLFKDHVYYLDPAMKKLDMPDKVVEWVPVAANDFQKRLYEYVLRDIDPITKRKIEKGLPVTEREARHILTKILQARQVLNGVHTIVDMPLIQSAEQTPKVKAVINDVEQHLKANPHGKVLIFTNFLRGGADVLAAGLNAKGVPFGVFVGADVPGGDYFGEEDRKKAIEAYRKGKIKVLILSPAGAEGLDLPNTTFVALFDPHYNPERILQMEARGVRIKGLKGVPPEKRKVLVRRYYTVIPRSFLAKVLGKPRKKTVEEWMYTIAANKAKLDNEFRELLRLRYTEKPLTLRPAAPQINIETMRKALSREVALRFKGPYKTTLPGLGVGERPSVYKKYLKRKWFTSEEFKDFFKKPRKPRSDKGKKRGPYHPRRPKSVIEMEKRKREMEKQRREQERRMKEMKATS